MRLGEGGLYFGGVPLVPRVPFPKAARAAVRTGRSGSIVLTAEEETVVRGVPEVSELTPLGRGLREPGPGGLQPWATRQAQP